jgi:N-acetylated-alpha-linked acidic dipeptidase
MRARSPGCLAAARNDSTAEEYEKALQRLDRLNTGDEAHRRQLAELNEVLYRTERRFRHETGLPRREWFKHLAYAPGLYTGYGVKTLPGIREAIEQKEWDEAERFVPIVAAAIRMLADDVDRSTHLLKKLAK